MATPEAQRRARAAHEKRLADAGWIKRTLRLSPEAVARIDALQASTGRPRETLVNEAIMAYRPAPPVQDTKAGPVADYEGKQAERRSRERPKTLSATLPAGDPVKAASEPQKRLSVDVPVIGSFERKPMQKSAPKGGKR